MEFYYKKNDNRKLFNTLVENNLLQVSQCQNYIPLYENFFTINNTNNNTINLNNYYALQTVKAKISDNVFNGFITQTSNDSKVNKNIFFKFSPLLDPIKYLIGKYDINDINLLNLPKYNDTVATIINNNCHEKMKDHNNSAYVDSFFNYLSSQMLHTHSFIHGLDFYGSFLAFKNDFSVEVTDDIEYMCDSEFFNNNKNILYTIDESQINQFLNNGTRNNKPKLKLDISSPSSLLDFPVVLELSDVNDLTQLDTILSSVEITNECQPSVEYESTKKIKEGSKDNKKDNKKDNENNDENEKDNESNSSCSSSFSNTDDEESGEEENDCDSSSSSSSSCSFDEENQLFVKIKTFPVQVISLECCHGTLDSLVENNNNNILSDEQWDSIVLQILMTLIAYQQCFHLTHNDLHSNNIMYSITDEPYIYYNVDEKYYKVPTYGRIFKIIDFGRAIYKFRGNLMCSDSYHKTGDAAGLYNIEPYFNNKKPQLGPNYSFDLCRLGCSLFDSIVDDVNDVEDIKSPILKIITDWCKDDKGKNIMYKTNGEERYPDFKLYKMIARLVHNHIPLNVLRNKHFNKYIVNIDDLPCYV